MSKRLVNVDRDTPMLLPVDLREWVPQDDLVHFVIAAVAGMKLTGLEAHGRGTGSAQYPPRMMLSLLIYCYALGVFSSRKIQRATWHHVGVRYLTGDTHPDHDTICNFRQENRELMSEVFLEVLKLAREMKLLKVGTISVDGTHVRASASKHKNVTYQRAGELEEQLREDIAGLLAQAQKADQEDKGDPERLPREIARREALEEKMAKARATLEERAKARAKAQEPQYQEKLKAREERKAQHKSGGGSPKPPDDKPGSGEQINLTDADSGLMKKGRGGECQQSYNAQAAVDADGSMLILATGVTDCPNDSQQLEPMTRAVAEEVGVVERVLGDSGYINVEAMERLEGERTLQDGSKAPEVELYVAVGREDNQRRYDYRPQAVTQKSAKEPVDERLKAMKEKLKTEEGRRIYAKRKQTVEPVFGIIKQAMGFRQFLMRGMEKVRGEWGLVCLAYNVRRLHSLVLQTQEA